MSLVALLGFVTVVLLALLLLNGYLWWRLVRSTTRPGRTRRGLTALLLMLGLLPALAIGLRGTLPRDAATPLDWVAYSWLGIAFYLFLTLLVLEPVRLLLRPWTRSRGDVEPSAARRAPPDAGTAPGTLAVQRDSDVMTTRATALPRRLFLARTLAVTAGAVALGTAGTGIHIANAAPVVRRVPITLPRLDPALDGLRIVTFSDAHLSATYGGRRFERLVEIVNAQRPDVVAIVGDLVDGSVEELREDVAPLADLVSEQGVFFVTGNHEYFVDTRAWLRHLPTLGVEVLHNERVAIRRGTAVRAAGRDRQRRAGRRRGDRRRPGGRQRGGTTRGRRAAR